MEAFAHFAQMAKLGLGVCSSHDGRHEYPGVLPTDMLLYGDCLAQEGGRVRGEGGWSLRTLDRYRARGGGLVPSLGGGSVRSDLPYVQGILHARLACALVARINLHTDKLALLPAHHPPLATDYVVVHVSDPRKERRALDPRGGLYGDITRVLCDITGR